MLIESLLLRYAMSGWFVITLNVLTWEILPNLGLNRKGLLLVTTKATEGTAIYFTMLSFRPAFL